ncbi:extensin family protein [Martelella sp. HB161492]|uniref:extensin-like domain-containing protein n=1 Tax=Martelella sp. HB161492 TaxID=2720726 RepID=UPI001590A031|nr:extensin family protein [Martelella sp. HB161492]
MTSFSIDTKDNSPPPQTRVAATVPEQPPVPTPAPGRAASPAPSIAKAAATPTVGQDVAQASAGQGTSIDGYLGFAAETPAVTIATTDITTTGPTDDAVAAVIAEAKTDIDPIETASITPVAPPDMSQMPPASQSPSQSKMPQIMPLAERQCRSELAKMGVSFAEMEAIANGVHCDVPYPIKLKGLSGDIKVSPAVTINCETALSLAEWVQNDVAPAVRVRYLTGIASINTMGGYSCRRMNNGSKNPGWSEHASGNAIDVGGLTLNSGKTIDVSKKSIFAFRERGLLTAIRTDSCSYFNTVLGPGYPEHDDHLHLDLMQRNSGKHYCE